MQIFLKIVLGFKKEVEKLITNLEGKLKTIHEI